MQICIKMSMDYSKFLLYNFWHKLDLMIGWTTMSGHATGVSLDIAHSVSR